MRMTPHPCGPICDTIQIPSLSPVIINFGKLVIYPTIEIGNPRLPENPVDIRHEHIQHTPLPIMRVQMRAKRRYQLYNHPPRLENRTEIRKNSAAHLIIGSIEINHEMDICWRDPPNPAPPLERSGHASTVFHSEMASFVEYSWKIGKNCIPPAVMRSSSPGRIALKYSDGSSLSCPGSVR